MEAIVQVKECSICHECILNDLPIFRSGKYFHKRCFCCSVCFNPINLEFIFVNNKLFCDIHFSWAGKSNLDIVFLNVANRLKQTFQIPALCTENRFSNNARISNLNIDCRSGLVDVNNIPSLLINKKIKIHFDLTWTRINNNTNNSSISLNNIINNRINQNDFVLVYFCDQSSKRPLRLCNWYTNVEEQTVSNSMSNSNSSSSDSSITSGSSITSTTDLNLVNHFVFGFKMPSITELKNAYQKSDLIWTSNSSKIQFVVQFRECLYLSLPYLVISKPSEYHKKRKRKTSEPLNPISLSDDIPLVQTNDISLLKTYKVQNEQKDDLQKQHDDLQKPHEEKDPKDNQLSKQIIIIEDQEIKAFNIEEVQPFIVCDTFVDQSKIGSGWKKVEEFHIEQFNGQTDQFHIETDQVNDQTEQSIMDAEVVQENLDSNERQLFDILLKAIYSGNQNEAARIASDLAFLHLNKK